MHVPTSKLRRVGTAGWLRQVLLFVTAYLLYGASRWVVTGDEASAFEHARSIVELEDASASPSKPPSSRQSTAQRCCGC